MACCMLTWRNWMILSESDLVLLSSKRYAKKYQSKKKVGSNAWLKSCLLILHTIVLIISSQCSNPFPYPHPSFKHCLLHNFCHPDLLCLFSSGYTILWLQNSLHFFKYLQLHKFKILKWKFYLDIKKVHPTNALFPVQHEQGNAFTVLKNFEVLM